MSDDTRDADMASETAAAQRPVTTIDFFGMYLAHDAFERDLKRLARAVAARRTGDPGVTAGWETLLRQLNRHHSTEDEVLWPTVREAIESPDDLKILDAMEAEHERVDELLDRVEAALAGARESLGADIEALQTALGAHLRHEEQVALPLIDRTVGAAGWAAFGREMRKRNGLLAVTEYLPWVLDDAAGEEKGKMLGLLPSPVRLMYRMILRPRYERSRSSWVADRIGSNGTVDRHESSPL